MAPTKNGNKKQQQPKPDLRRKGRAPAPKKGGTKGKGKGRAVQIKNIPAVKGVPRGSYPVGSNQTSPSGSSRAVTRPVFAVATASGGDSSGVPYKNGEAKAGSRVTMHYAPTSFRSYPSGEHEHRPGLGDPNKVGRNIQAMNSLKNMSSRAQTSSNHHAEKLMKDISRKLNMKEVCSPDACRVADLMDNPFTAPWGDEGEMQVKNLTYEEAVPPSTTATCRNYGQITVSGAAGQAIWVVMGGGAMNQQNIAQIDFSGDDGDTTRFAAPILAAQKDPLPYLCFTPGAPFDGRDVAASATGVPVGGGCAGYWYTSNVTDAPYVDFSAAPGTIGGVATANGGQFYIQNILQWGNEQPFGDMDPGDSSQYKFRPVAAGLRIVPIDAELSVGGQVNAAVIPQATNEIYTTKPAIVGASESSLPAGSVQKWYALPDHSIDRGDNTIDVHWLPGRQDYSFLQTVPVVSGVVGTQPQVALQVPAGVENISVAASVGVYTGCNTARLMVQIIPPFTKADVEAKVIHSYTLAYVSFYEVAGKCIQTSGTVPRPQPSLGAKMATAVQNSLNTDLDDRRQQIGQGTTLEVAKDHPTLGPMIERDESLGGAKSTLKEILGFGEKLLPFAAMLL